MILLCSCGSPELNEEVAAIPEIPDNSNTQEELAEVIEPEPTISIVGDWRAIAAENENGEACLQEVMDNHYFNFLDSTTFKMATPSYETDEPDLTNGTYILLDGSIQLTYEVGGSEVKLDVPILNLTKDTLVLDYNVCPAKDTITHARFTMLRME